MFSYSYKAVTSTTSSGGSAKPLGRHFVMSFIKLNASVAGQLTAQNLLTKHCLAMP